MKSRLILVISAFVALVSCSTIKDGIELAEKVGISFNPALLNNQKAIDSINIAFKPLYLIENIDTTDSEKEIIQDGYRIWILQTSNVRRMTIQRLDTNIKVYKK